MAGSSVPPWLTALSAVSTLNSGYMFTGFVGFTYLAGLDAIWLSIGWIVGDFVASLFVYKQLRIASGRTKEVSFAALLAHWHGSDNFRVWRRIAAVLTVIFLASYAAAQISAGGKALYATLDWAPETGAIITAVMVIIYCSFGGIRASIWTDAAQFVVMAITMTLLLVVGVQELGGPSAAYQQLRDVPNYLDVGPADLMIPGTVGFLLFIAGWVFAGFSIIGQPHIMVRYMALESPEQVSATRIWYYSFYILFTLLAFGAGILAKVLLPEIGAIDPELSFPTMARDLLPEVLVGLVLAGVFAATMSTVDSLVLSSSAAITNDLLPRKWETTWLLRGVTAGVALVALGIALSGNQSVFDLVILSWSTLAAAFAPLLTIYAFNREIRERWAILVMLSAVCVALLWRYFGLHNGIYEGLPGILTGLGIAWVTSSKSQ
ncbi:MAG: sodium/proline symporter [Pseudomonadota bacterium]